MEDNNNILAILNNFTLTDEEDVAMQIAADFRKRRIEKELTREAIAEKAGVPLSNVRRFEQTGQISLRNLISLCMALGYVSELSKLFSTPKYSTIEELTQIRRNTGKKKAHTPHQ